MVQAREQTTRARDEFDRQKNELLTDLAEKDSKIIELTKKQKRKANESKRSTTPGTQVSEDWVEV